LAKGCVTFRRICADVLSATLGLDDVIPRERRVTRGVRVVDVKKPFVR
jgi:hypothetical protein